jgi:hypothetical protein
VHFDQPLPLSVSGTWTSGAMSSSTVYQTPLGPLKLVANSRGITAVKFLFGKHGDWPVSAGPGLEHRLEPGGGSGDGEESDSENAADFHLEVCRRWLDAYFDGSLLKSDAPPRPKLVFAEKS